MGGGLAGVACARALVDALPDREVRLLDRGRRLGGRMASRRVEDRPVDLGASYLTVDDERFAAVVDDWRGRGLAAPWTDTFHAVSATDGGPPRPKQGPTRWGAAGGLRSLVEDLAAPLPDLRSAHVVEAVTAGGGLAVDGEPAAAVVLAMPDAQARRLVEADPALGEVAGALTRPSDPVLALVATYDERRWDLDGLFVNDHDVVAWVADDGRRRFDGAPVLVAHSTPAHAERWLDDPDAGGPAMVAALRELLDLPEPRTTLVQRWSLAKASGEREDPYLLAEAGGGLVGVCGDGWGATSKVETAYLSGRTLGEALAARL